MTPREEAILTAFATEQTPLAELARRHNLSLARLADLLSAPDAQAFFAQLQQLLSLRARLFLFEKLARAALAPTTPPAETRRIAAFLTREPKPQRAPAPLRAPAAPAAPSPQSRPDHPPSDPIWPFGHLEFGHLNPPTLRAAAGAPTAAIPRAHPPPPRALAAA